MYLYSSIVIVIKCNDPLVNEGILCNDVYLVSIAFAHFPVKVSLGLHVVCCEKNDTRITEAAR